MTAPPPEWVEIHYRRLPDRLTVYRQRVLHRDAEVVVTFLPAADIREPFRIAGQVVLEPGAPVVWFTYPGRWHDIGRFHTADGRFTGYYANVLTPVEMRGPEWHTTDLCLDVWRGVDDGVRVLDEEELETAERSGWLDGPTAARARTEAETLTAQARTNQWPPRHVREWTIDRVPLTIPPREYER